MKDALAELETEAERVEEKRREWRGANTSEYTLKSDARKLTRGCEVCEGLPLINLLHDYVDGLHRIAGPLQRNMRLLEREEQRLELAAREYFAFESKETGAEVKAALSAWLEALKRSRGEI